jgi:hypothetical protein
VFFLFPSGASLITHSSDCCVLVWVVLQVIQMLSLMDRLLKLENLDLQLTPYRVLATAQDEGMVEFVPSISLAQVQAYTCCP